MNYADLKGFIFLDGEIVEWNKAKLHVLSHGLHYASSVFEGERSYNKKVFKEQEHTDRLIHSARTLGFELPHNSDEIMKIRKSVLDANKISDGYISASGGITASRLTTYDYVQVNDGEEGGVSVVGEIYKMSDKIWARVEDNEPPHLYKGPVKLVSGNTMDGILFPRDLAEKPTSGYIDISSFGDWRKYMAHKNKL